MRVRGAWSLGMMLLPALVWAQAPGEVRLHAERYTLPPVLVVGQSNNVPLTVVVRDPKGRVITGLSESRFRISDNGVPQTLVAFREEDLDGRATVPAGDAGASPQQPAALLPSSPRATPRYVALLFDDVNSDRADLMQARNAAMRFLKEQLGAGDRMGLFTTSQNETLDFTQDRAALAADIAKISVHPRANGYGFQGCPRITPYEAYQISVLHDQGAMQSVLAEAASCEHPAQAVPLVNACGLNCTFGKPPPMSDNTTGIPPETQALDTWEMTRGAAQDTLAVVRSVVDETAQQPGQRIVVLASSGFFSETLDQQKEQIEHDALRAGVVINALDAKGMYTEDVARPFDQDQYVLPLATYVFEEANKFPEREAQADAMASLAEATGGLYFRNNNDLTLGFERLGLAPETDYTMAYSPVALVRDGAFHQLKIALNPPVKGAIIEARRGYFAPPPGPTEAELAVGLDRAMRSQATTDAVPAAVKFSTSAEVARVQVKVEVTQPQEKLTLVAALFDAQGHFVSGEQGEVDLALQKKTYDRLRNSGLAPSFSLHAPSGKYRLRVVVQDHASGALSEFNQDVKVP